MGRTLLKNYTDDLMVQIKLERASGLTYKDIAENHGVEVRSLINAVKKFDKKITRMEPALKEYFNALDVVLSQKIKMVLDSITQEKCSQASLPQLTNSLNNLNNIRRLERGEATSQSEVKYTSVDLTEHLKPIDITPKDPKKLPDISPSMNPFPSSFDPAVYNSAPIIPKKEYEPEPVWSTDELDEEETFDF
jgi:hypothetical protein